jgi:wyosine [tRNA(Phe)-imidazoG37] synthetase (radical SAM superfamily)
MILRDQTLYFIKKISIFIRSLTVGTRTVDKELKEIMVALNNLIDRIEITTVQIKTTTTTPNNDHRNSKAIINEKINELERLMNLIIDELKQTQLDDVINTSLELAKTANELFLTITKTNTVV